MAHFIENKYLDKKKWDSLINSSPNGTPYAYSWYLDAVCDNWGIFCNKDMRAGIPVCLKKKAGVKIIYQPKFTRQFGFYGKPDKKIITAYFNYIQNHFTEIILGLDVDLADYCNLKYKKFIYQYLVINKNYETLKQTFSTNALRLIKKAEKSKLIISTDISAEQFITFFIKNKASYIKDLDKKDYSTLLKIIKTAQKNNALKILSVLNNNEIHASASFIFMPDKVLYLKGTANEQGRKTGAMYYLFDYFIKTHCNKYQLLDFNGSRIKGIADFNLKWGAVNGEYLFIEDYNSPVYFKILKKIKKAIKM